MHYQSSVQAYNTNYAHKMSLVLQLCLTINSVEYSMCSRILTYIELWKKKKITLNYFFIHIWIPLPHKEVRFVAANIYICWSTAHVQVSSSTVIWAFNEMWFWITSCKWCHKSSRRVSIWEHLPQNNQFHFKDVHVVSIYWAFILCCVHVYTRFISSISECINMLT